MVCTYAEALLAGYTTSLCVILTTPKTLSESEHWVCAYLCTVAPDQQA